MIGPDFFERRTNRIVDPGFEYGALRHDQRTVMASVTDSSGVVSAPVLRGAYSLRVSCSANGNAATTGELVVVGWRTVASAGQTWSSAAQAGFITAGFRGRLKQRFLNSAASQLASAQADSTGAT